LRQALESQDFASLIRSDLGAIFYNRGNFTGAEREWLAALSYGPGNAFALDNMAILRHHQHRYAESLDYSWRALRGRPAYATAHINLAETLADMGRDAEADWQFRLATTLSPLSTKAHNKFGEFLIRTGRMEDARNEYERSVEADSTSNAYDQLGKIYLSWQDIPRAEQSFRHSLAVDAFNIDAHVGLGQVLESKGDSADALNEFEKGLEMDPSDKVAKAAALRLRGNISPKTLTQ
jgi:Tfp pilus assembly protein PilF